MSDPRAGSRAMSNTRHDRRAHATRIRRRRALVGGAAAALVLALSVAGVALLTGDSEGAQAPSTTTTTAPATTTTAAVPGATIASTAVDSLVVRTEPNEAAPALETFEATTLYGHPTTMLVEQSAAESTPGWLPVVVPFHKPNSTVGWVPEKEVTLSETTYSIEISLAAHELVLRNAGAEVLRTPVILGTPETPTPPGRFYVTDPLNCNEETVPGYPVGECSSAYGAFAIGISGLSEALDSFQGTIPQLAVHGTDLPDSEMGKDLSNGCIRIPNAVVLEIARTVPLLGVPVNITA